jgi:Predicted acyltransferases
MDKTPKHFYSLDALRGLAALAVVCWHWQHFFYQGQALKEFSMASQPFYRVLSLFYNSGDRAVDLFFCLSGFVFYWLYSAKVKTGAVTAARFTVLRFSRLYPLHFVTLMAVLVMQTAMLAQTGNLFHLSI